MPKSSSPTPTFNLWTEAWIALERPDGSLERLGLEEALLRAHEFRIIYEPSPLVVVGIHRLLTAILQAVLNPQKKADLKKLWAAGQFSERAVRAFGKQYAERFDLFSESAPFLQSANLPLQPNKGDDTKNVSILTVDTSRSTTIEHYRHGRSKDEFFCAACAASGLVTIPPFTSSGGRGLKPSINGVPPIYVLPGGKSLYESLAASLVTPEYQPRVASKKNDAAWWTRRPKVERSKELREVGYLHSLTFPARRVRLHPERLDIPCTRCGRTSEWGVRTMIFEMGECRPKDAEPWFDPFAAFRLQETKPPTPIRPVPGRAMWREYAGLFLQVAAPPGSKLRTQRPSVLDQIAALELEQSMYPFRCVGLRTDMKAKVFEWIDAGFDVPPALLRDDMAGLAVDKAIQFATECERIASSTFRAEFGKSKKVERYRGLRERMESDFWASLAGSFHQFVLTLAATPDQARQIQLQWANAAVQEALEAFKRATAALNDDAPTLRKRVEGERACAIRLFGYKRKQYPQEEESNE